MSILRSPSASNRPRNTAEHYPRIYPDGELRSSPRILTVPSCRECNGLAGASYQPTLTERKKYIKDKLRHRYRKIIEMPEWEEAEIEELGRALKTHVLVGIEQRKLILQRLAW